MADVELAWTSLDRPAKRLSLPVGVHRHGHPTEKPLALMRWCLSFVPDGATILDPFMGSGTTGVACAKLGRSEEHTSELQSLMRISYAAFCLKKKRQKSLHDNIYTS